MVQMRQSNELVDFLKVMFDDYKLINMGKKLYDEQSGYFVNFREFCIIVMETLYTPDIAKDFYHDESTPKIFKEFTDYILENVEVFAKALGNMNLGEFIDNVGEYLGDGWNKRQ